MWTSMKSCAICTSCRGKSLRCLKFDCPFCTVTKFYEEEEAFTRRLEEEEQALEQDRRRLAELHLVDAQRRRVEADATMAVVAAQNRALANTGFSTDDLGLPDEGNSVVPPDWRFWKGIKHLIFGIINSILTPYFLRSYWLYSRSIPVSPK